MSHPIQFRVFLPNLKRPIYTTGLENGELVFLHPESERFIKVSSPEVEARYGKPIIQLSTGIKDKCARMIFEGDVVFWRKFNWVGIIMHEEKEGKPCFWCQMQNGCCSLIGLDIVGEVIVASYHTNKAKIQEYLGRAKDILEQNNFSDVKIER